MADAPLYLNQPEAKKDNDLLCCGCFAVFLLLILIGGMAMFGSFGDNPNENAEGTPRYSSISTGGDPSDPTTAGEIEEDCLDKALAKLGYGKQKIKEIKKNYLPYFNGASQKYTINPAFIMAIAHNETHFNPGLTSPVGAQGMMQIMPGTWINTKDDGNADGKYDPYNAADSIYSGTRYIKGLSGYKYIGNDPRLIAAAYNAGPGAVDKYKGIPPYRETEKYVKRVMEAFEIFNDCLARGQLNLPIKVHDNIQKLIDYANKHDWGQGGSNQCFAYAKKLIIDVFPSAQQLKMSATKVFDRTKPPSDSQLQEIADLLAQGKIPLWHVNGQYSGQHWIIPVHIGKDKSITFLDSVGKGSIRTLPYDHFVKQKQRGWEGSFFGHTPKDNWFNGYYYEIK